MFDDLEHGCHHVVWVRCIFKGFPWLLVRGICRIGIVDAWDVGIGRHMAPEKYIVKPVYFRDDLTRSTVRKLYLIYSLENAKYEHHDGGQYLVPNFIINGRNNIVDDLERWFAARAVGSSSWRMTPPVYESIDELGAYIGLGDPEDV